MSVTLRKKVTKKKGASWYLDIYDKGKRVKKFLGLFGTDADTVALARRIRKNTEQEIAAGKYHVVGNKDRVDLMLLHENYKSISDYWNFKSSLIAFSKMTGRTVFYCSELTEDLCIKFKQYLHDNYKGETPVAYLHKFKRMVKDATKRGLFAVNPCLELKNENPTSGHLKKDYLTVDEVQILYNTPCNNELLKSAFLFSINTGGLRYCDVCTLLWSEVKMTDKMIIFTQDKTTVQNFVPLNDNALEILKSLKKESKYVFPLTHHYQRNKTLKKWIEDAKIKKHLTFGVSRHTAATMLLRLSNETIASKLLGHTTTKMMRKYTHVIDEERKATINLIPSYRTLKK